MPKVVIAPILPKPLLEVAAGFKPDGYDLTIAEPGTAEFTAAMKEAEYLVGFPRGGMDAAFYKNASKLKLVQLISAGYDRVDIEAARQARVPVANNGGSNSVAVAEATLMLILSVHKRLVWQHGNVVQGKWRIGDFGENRLYELAGKTLGIVGLGTIGKKVARRALAFDMTVQYYDIARLSEAEEDALGVRFVLLSELMRTADVVTLHVPLNDGTRSLIGAREIGLMKPSAILVNTCRGPVVDEAALYQALQQRRIGGAGLDVLVDEPPAKDHPLFGLFTVTLTPHSAGPTWENWTARFRNGFDNIERVAAGRRPLWVIPELA